MNSKHPFLAQRRKDANCAVGWVRRAPDGVSFSDGSDARRNPTLGACWDEMKSKYPFLAQGRKDANCVVGWVRHAPNGISFSDGADACRNPTLGAYWDEMKSKHPFLAQRRKKRQGVSCNCSDSNSMPTGNNRTIFPLRLCAFAPLREMNGGFQHENRRT
ncbi:MAG: hypothetical protein KJ867_03360 [Gammaproteobacteria bacterium]|nr:hypothetical protein [Gammaproteobacteria bacterium]